MIDNFLSWSTIVLTSAIASMVPGLSFALVLKNTVQTQSRKIGMLTALGLSAGMLVYVILICLGFSVFLQNPIINKTLKYCGSVYLAYLGVKSLIGKKEAISLDGINTDRNHFVSKSFAFSTGFLTNVLNPKVFLFFIALFTQFVNEHTSPIVVLLYGVTVVVIELLWFISVSVLISNPYFLEILRRFSVTIEKILGVLFILISIAFVYS
jgi:threonine efflux protein